jgi:hypothetical protein
MNSAETAAAVWRPVAIPGGADECGGREWAEVAAVSALGAVVAENEILVSSELPGFDGGVALAADVRLRPGRAVDDELAVTEGDQLTG